MPFGKAQLLAVAGALTALMFIAVVFFFPLISPFEKSGVNTNTFPGSTVPSGANVPGNAFLPNQEIQGTLRGSAPPAAPSVTRYQEPSLEGLKNFVPLFPPAFVPSPQEQPTLALPQISDAEIRIDPQGIATTEAYVTYFATHFADIRFENGKLGAVLKDEYKLPLLPIALIEKGIQDNNFSEVRDSLLIYKEFIQARIAFVQSIGVSGEAVPLDKKMIAFDRLTLSLIDKFFAAAPGAPGTPSGSDFKNFFEEFKTTALFENGNLLKRLNISAFLQRSDFFSSLIRRLGIDIASAFAGANLPFGGKIKIPKLCSCSLGFLVKVGDPTPPINGSLFVPIAFLVSPLFFPFKSIKPGSWWLGLYVPVPVPCAVGFPPFCHIDGFGPPVLMTGTSG